MNIEDQGHSSPNDDLPGVQRDGQSREGVQLTDDELRFYNCTMETEFPDETGARSEEYRRESRDCVNGILALRQSQEVFRRRPSIPTVMNKDNRDLVEDLKRKEDMGEGLDRRTQQEDKNGGTDKHDQLHNKKDKDGGGEEKRLSKRTKLG
ncbi:uncharacterized protein KY384_002900 [Bacidia gigantensis]|uniref:uncharacterized protein n=1 Tax=Bacidia gigantensis TaxID=2732470 RepID=UPI001D04A568|nr:uncharacterized protein KY384_002900 [Bacidia gigantensis]KAG8532415.1 hypothetical protein KY384_002900 [Bacidia gigantensis]